MDLASPAVSGTSVYANGLKKIRSHAPIVLIHHYEVHRNSPKVTSKN